MPQFAILGKGAPQPAMRGFFIVRYLGIPMIEAAFITQPQVCKLLGISRSSVERLRKTDSFPKPRQLGVRLVGFRVSEIQAWMDRLPPAQEQPTWLVGKQGKRKVAE
jgi:predicted DNA-binding transcriptional regulator AlpA